ncbi:MAG: MrtC family glutamic-type intramembrane protease [Myxococcales bacterium]|nr:MrtC family glutamic-type intramembrane protease [Myxococcales bacterium]
MSATREGLWVFGGVTVGTVLISLAGRVPALAEYVHLGVGILFLGTAVHMAGRAPGGLEGHGLSLGGLLEPAERPAPGLFDGVKDLAGALLTGIGPTLRELGVALALAALIFPPFAYGFYLWNAPPRAFELAWPPELASYALSQVLVIALPEEAFFRGYLQTRLAEGRRRVKVLGAELSLPVLVLTSALFALIHFAVDPHPARLAVFFPALVFGWLRELRGGIGAAVFFHALSNLLSDVLARSWL